MANKEATLLIRIKEAGSEALSKVSSGLASITKIASAAGAALIALGVASVKAYAEQERANNALNQSLVQQGIYTKQLSQDYQNLATALSKKSAFGDEEIIQGQAVLQSYLGQTKITKELMQATLDLAAAKGIDLKSASEMVGKSIGTTTNALARQGIQMSEGLSKTEKLAEVTDRLTQKFGGQAEAQTKGLGSLQQMQNAFGELLEIIGERLQPVVVFVAQAFTKLANELQTNQQFLDGVTTSIQFVAQAGTILHGVLMGVAQAVGGALGTAFGAVSQIMEGNFKQAYETIKSGASQLGDDLSTRWQTTKDNLDAIDQLFLTKKQQNLVTEEEMIRQSEANKAAIIAESNMIRDEEFNVRSQAEIEKLMVHEQIKNDALLSAEWQRLSKEQEMAKTREAQLDAELKKRKFLEEQYQKDRMKNLEIADQFDMIMSNKRVQRANQTLSDLAQMQDSKNKELVAIGKAAAIAQIGIQTAQAVMNVWGWASGIPFVGPVLAAGLTAAIVGYGAEQISRVNSAQMADGGIVTARPGGMLATIGEGGRDEAVIPLDDGMPGGGLGGGTYVINVYGGMLGDPSSAREFARAVDEELHKLRKSNASLAFDSGVT